MPGMTMAQETWFGAAARYLGMLMLVMVPMMLPSLVPMLSRYRRSARGTHGIHLHGLTALVAIGYLVIWAVLGAVAYGVGAGIMAAMMHWEPVAEWLPLATGGALLLAAGVQFTSWKARQLARCREDPACGSPHLPNASSAWCHGLTMGVRCSLCCGSLMLALLATGMMDLVAMAAVTLAISAERLAPAPLRVARVAGVAIVVVGLLTIARV